MKESNMTVDQQIIQKAILAYYHAGHAQYDPELYRKILHPEWKLFQIVEGNLEEVDRDEFCDWYAPEKFDPGLVWETDIFSIDITGDVAAVKLSIQNQKVKYIDYLNLMKIDRKWWIVHKIYHEIQQ
ncbi:MAG: nuclear transport factor 2 family protein [Anaerolineales bacterium]|nr:nuclear transport factor 2 family protein [Anaerolineales bacterium]